MIRNRQSIVTLCALAASFGCASENNSDVQTAPPQIGDFVPVASSDPAGTGDMGMNAGAPAAPADVGAVLAPTGQDINEGIIVENEQDEAQKAAEDGATCGENSEPTKLQDIVLAFAFDRSGSMALDETERGLKWDPVVAATKAFFADQTSEGLLATLTFFPDAGGGGFGFGGGGGACNVNDYATPDVDLTALPSEEFGTAIDGVEPDGMGTPTMPVLEGTIEAIRAMQTDDAVSAKFVIVLVTDGLPTSCSEEENDINNVAAVAAEVAGEIPTYVIGVDSPTASPGAAADADGLANLDLIAQQGGTDKAFIVSTGNAEQTATDFRSVIETIRESAFSCNVAIPKPDSGQEFDSEKVNVNYSNTKGVTEFVYDPSCTEQFAWHYDDEANPSVIEMCANVCEQIKADIENEGQLNVEFGCIRRIGGTR